MVDISPSTRRQTRSPQEYVSLWIYRNNQAKVDGASLADISGYEKMAAIVASRPQFDMLQRRWESRIDRARELQQQYVPSAVVLRFCQAVLEFQRDVAISSESVVDPVRPLREQLDLSYASSKMFSILHIAANSGPEWLAAKAKEVQKAGEDNWRERLQRALVGTESEPVDDFFARSCLQPILENLQFQLPADENYSKSVCPACGGLPQAAVLRPEGDGARRWLMCSWCLREWVYRRVVCPWCGEEDKEKLPRYSVEECPHVRVEGCETCKRYLKAVDLTISGRAIPLVDEVALAVFDVWAGNQGYTKITPNLMGF
jgi:FdhE protein